MPDRWLRNAHQPGTGPQAVETQPTMDFGLKNKSVLVLASSQGIGSGAAQAFAQEGARVMLFGRNETKLAQVRDRLVEETQATVEFTAGDITKAGDLANAIARTQNNLGPIYALFNNTGGPPPGGFDAFDDAAWQSAYELTLLSYIRAIRGVLPHMRAAGGGRIVSVASSSTKASLDNLILSNVFRTGLLGLTKSLSAELGRDGILINLLSPGKIATERVDTTDGKKAAQLNITKEALQEQTKRQIPLGRYGEVEEIGRVAAFLCSPANTYTSGQNIVVDGGLGKSY